tara:strand:- start:10338 stop:10904 length:567 start_codon:yes stop_codon:yes gene_type:complete
MAVQTINTDIAAEVNISARRNDTFSFQFTVANPTAPTEGLPMNTAQSGAATYPKYQAKMSIVDANTGDLKLSLYSSFWQGTDETIIIQQSTKKTVKPTATTAGEYSGEETVVSNVKSGGAIDFSANTSVVTSKAKINVPYDYMVFEPGEYLYDLQIREQDTSGNTNTISYTTWMFGKFTLNPDITSVS